MSTTDQIVCPDCDGAKTLTAIVKYAPGFTGPKVRELACPACNGAGSVSPEQIRLMDRGDEFRRYRVDTLHLGLRQAAQQWGMLPSELSKIEQGRVETDWVPPGFSE